MMGTVEFSPLLLENHGAAETRLPEERLFFYQSASLDQSAENHLSSLLCFIYSFFACF